MDGSVRISLACKILALASLFILMSLGLFAVGLGNWMVTALLAWPGALLFKSFHVLALYVPVFLGVLAAASSVPRLKEAFFVPLLASLAPFFTGALLVRLLTGSDPSPATQWFLENLGTSGSQLFLGMLLVLEILVIAAVSVAAYQKRETLETLDAENESGITAEKGLWAEFGAFWGGVFQRPSDNKDEDPFEAPLWRSKGETPVTEAPQSPEPQTSAASAASFPPAQPVDAPDEILLETPSSYSQFMGFTVQSKEPEPIPAVVRSWAAQEVSSDDLRKDPFFDVPEGAHYHSQALEVLTSTMNALPTENSPAAFDLSPVAQTITDEVDEAAVFQSIFDEAEDAEAEVSDADEVLEMASPEVRFPNETEEQERVPEELTVVDWDLVKARVDAEEETEDFDEDDEDFDREMESRLTKELSYQRMVERVFAEPAEPEAALVIESADAEFEDTLAELNGHRKASLGEASTFIRPLEGGNSVQPKTIIIPDPASGIPVVTKAPVSTDLSSDRLFTATHYAQKPKFGSYHVPILGILTAYKEGDFTEIDEATKRAAHTLKMTLQEFNISADVTGIRKGPVVTMFEILPAAGVKLSKIVALQDNIALGLAATSVRIVAPIPGKHAVGIEVPNRERTLVGFAEMISSKEFQESKAEIPMVLGKDISGETQIIDLTRTPHLLIAGATGAGKSVCVNTLVCSILYRRSPDEVRLLMVDPKVVELKFFNDIPHLLAPVITEPKKALQAVQWCLYEMERRYALLDALGAKDIRSYNAKIEKRHIATNKLPYIVLVIDEFADLMATSGKDLEGTIARLAAMSRAVGIHLVLATQRPSVDVITGLIKANFPSRIAFMVASKTDSRIIIDQMGAEKLLGRGDMLFTSSWNPFPSRVQGAFLSEDDVERVVGHVKTLGEPEYISDEIFYDEEAEADLATDSDSSEADPLFEKAVEIVRTFKKASASFLQRRLGVGYNRAARMIEMMEEMGIVGPQNGSKPREIVHS